LLDVMDNTALFGEDATISSTSASKLLCHRILTFYEIISVGKAMMSPFATKG